MLCEVCYQNNDLLFSIADCEHKYCLGCCLQHISTKADLFVDIFCPFDGCKKPFNKQPQIMNRLPNQTIKNIKKRQRFVYLLNNPTIKQCSATNCDGLINFNQTKKVCNKCYTPHCPKCIKPFHEGPCLLSNEDRQMKQLSYQKCPKCHIWVQKKQGCNYVDCKCGLNFCYYCGVSFSDDPCRLKQIWALEASSRNLIANIKIKIPQNKSDCVSFIIKLPFKIIFLLLFTLLAAVLLNCIILIILAVVIILSPILVLIISCSANKTFIKVLVILLLPLLTGIAIILIVLLVLGYPLLRRTAHHGIYDGFDFGVNFCTHYYLKTVRYIF